MFDYNKIININPITPVLTEDSNSDIMLHQSNKISKPIQTSRNDKKEDIRLKYVLTMLDIPILIQFFRDSKITFIDFLFLTKEDLQTLGFKIYQRNRILNFSNSFKKFAKKYDMNEIKNFFKENNQFNFNLNNEQYQRKNTEYSTHKNEPKTQTKTNFSSRPNSTNLSSRVYCNKNLNNKKNVSNNKLNSFSSRNRKFRSSYDTYKKYLIINKEVNDYMKKVNQTKKGSSKFIIHEKALKIQKTENNRNLQLKNKEYQLTLNNINNTENNSLRTKSITSLNKTKNFIDHKGNNINLEEINRINNDINKIKELNNRKEKLKQQLKAFDEAIIKKKNIISHLRKNSKNNINNIKKEIIDVQVNDDN